MTRRAKHWQNGIIDRSWCCPRGRSPARVFRSDAFGLILCLLTGPALFGIGALHLVAAIGQLSAIASEVSVVDDPENDGLVVDLLEHQVLAVWSGVHILYADSVPVRSRLQCAIGADPDGVRELNTRAVDSALVRGSND